MSNMLRVASLFCGCGGTDVGLLGGFTFNGKSYSKNPIDIVYANDIDEKAADIFESNFSIDVDRRDIRDVKAIDIPDHDILTGGFPCQSFSILAQNPPRLGYKDEKGRLFFEILRIIKAKKPKILLFENVKGLLSANKGMAFKLFLKELEDAGYPCMFKVLNSKDFGVPQKRERVFIVGWKKSMNLEFSFPNPTHTNNETPLKIALEKSFDPKYFFSEKAVKGMKKSNRMTNGKMNKGRAQDINLPCNTVTAHLAKVTLNGTDPVLLEGKKYRRFTPREVARIQSFPEKFKLIGSDSAQYRALGNAIPPVLFWHLTKNLISAIEKPIQPKSKRSPNLEMGL